MRIRILGTGQIGCMKNEIILDVFDAFVIKNLIEKAIKENESCGYDFKKWNEFINKFHMAFTIPSEMD